MTDLLAARSQMAMSLAFHILFSVVGMAMPLLMVLAERHHLKTGDPVALVLAKRWAKGTAILFGVGAVSGTVLSFELGLLWPEFMAFAGPIIGLPFSMEGFAFFLEAIFLGLYLYGWDRLSPRLHLAAGGMVALSGTLSGAFVVTANAWMNTPTGFTLDAAGKVVSVDPVAAMLNPAAFTQALHMTLAAFVAVGAAVSAIHAWMLLREPTNRFHRLAFRFAGMVGAVTALLIPLSGDLSAKHVAHHQPVKLAAMEGHWETERGAPLKLGGWPDEEAEVTRYALDIPYALSFLAFADPNAEVRGLKDFPRDVRPPVAPVHIAFQIMVGCGTALMLVGGLGLFLAWRQKTEPVDPRFLKLVVAVGPLGILAVQAGWTVTEVGRQPWVIHGILRTSQAVTPMPGLWATFTSFSLLYLFLGWVVIRLLKRQVFESPTEAELQALERSGEVSHVHA